AVVAINRLLDEVGGGGLDLAGARAALEAIEHAPPAYRRWEVVAALGLTAASLSRLFGGDWPCFALALLAGAACTWVRLELAGRPGRSGSRGTRRSRRWSRSATRCCSACRRGWPGPVSSAGRRATRLARSASPSASTSSRGRSSGRCWRDASRNSSPAGSTHL